MSTHVRFRAKREHLKRVQRHLSESQGQNLALTVLCVPYSLDNGTHLHHMNICADEGFRPLSAQPVLVAHNLSSNLSGQLYFRIRFRAKGNNLKGCQNFYLKLRPESGLDCLLCAIFARQRSSQLVLRISSSLDIGHVKRPP